MEFSWISCLEAVFRITSPGLLKDTLAFLFFILNVGSCCQSRTLQMLLQGAGLSSLLHQFSQDL